MKFLAILASIAFVQVWASPTQNANISKGSRIIGGEEADLGQFPWQAGIYIDKRDFCGGTLITNEWILTSAECIYGHTTFIAVLGVKNLNAALVGYHTSKTVIHEDYEAGSLRNAVGLLKLEQPIEFTDTIHPIMLSGDDIPAETEIVVTGFGKLSDNSDISTDKLYWVNLTTKANEDCADIFTEFEEELMCANQDSDGVHGICGGDIGGPAVTYAGPGSLLVAINLAQSSAGCDFGHPSVFTRIQPYLEWIAIKINSE